ncbi:DUF2461 domain-containing protein [Halocynthiibacter sp. C4]|uniref:DUF2461 domain-containing protein n=1 Tax=Halocynthiibacter sp. C4 TaxID=2992758 RepID=UPI00237BB82D|nr:DUF2461 domain-containing protein [Halocynthiibacter sp. C4]MDE0589589.1 DUF2461 domain-containing protein [Halocynthiibacter sp. C4]
MFSGFSPELFEFLRELEQNNSKDWFDANREIYETHYKQAAQDFIAAISPKMAALQPPLQAIPKVNGSLRRINRDIRFSKDKTPYHTNMHLVFWAGDHPNRSAGMHFVLKANGLGFGAGYFGMVPVVLARYRKAVCDDDTRQNLEAALATAAEVGSKLEPPSLARVPRGLAAYGPEAEFLKHKAFVARTFDDVPYGAWIKDGDETIAQFMALTKAHMPLISWLADLDGPENGSAPDVPR